MHGKRMKEIDFEFRRSCSQSEKRRSKEEEEAKEASEFPTSVWRRGQQDLWAKLFEKCLSCEMFLDFLQKEMDKTVHVHVLKATHVSKNVIRICYE